MLKSIAIKGLFGRFDYEIELKNGGITIITGPNGFGKSTILKIINAFKNGGLYQLIGFSYQTLLMTFDNNQQFELKKSSEEISINEIKFHIPSFNNKKSARKRGLPSYIERIGPNEYIDLRTRERMLINDSRLRIRGDMYNFDTDDDFFFDIMDECSTRDNNLAEKELNKIKSVIAVMKKVRSYMPEVKLIKEQRLIEENREPQNEFEYSDRAPKIIQVIDRIPNDIKKEIESVLNAHSILSNQLDSSYPTKLFSSSEGITQVEYSEKLKELTNNQKNLNKYELAEISNISSVPFNPNYATALKIYFDDSKTKYSVFEPLVKKLETFLSLVNGKLYFKEIFITKKSGMIVRDIESKKELSLNQLSSGEQQIIVLYYDLIFGATGKLFLLIDEPEISLHISWQKELLDDFKRILEIKKKEINIVIATHSPQVINENWDLQIDLGMKYGN
ncbi:MAG: AAA family ATPase [Candidatus Izemoplasmatales bacterium]